MVNNATKTAPFSLYGIYNSVTYTYISSSMINITKDRLLLVTPSNFFSHFYATMIYFALLGNCQEYEHVFVFLSNVFDIRSQWIILTTKNNL